VDAASGSGVRHPPHMIPFRVWQTDVPSSGTGTTASAGIRDDWCVLIEVDSPVCARYVPVVTDGKVLLLWDTGDEVAEASSITLARSTVNAIIDRFNGVVPEFLAVTVGALTHRYSGTDLVVACAHSSGHRRWLLGEQLLAQTPKAALRLHYTGQADTDVQVFVAWAEDRGITMTVRLRRGVLTDTGLRVLGEQLDGFLRVATSDHGHALSELPGMSDQQVHDVVQQWNATSRPYPDERSAPALFFSHAQRRPDTPAVITKDGVLTYGKLCAAAVTAARALRARGVGDGDLVALLTWRGAESIVATLAIAFAGAVCLPLDPDYPRARLELMLDHPRVCCMVIPAQRPAVAACLDVSAVVLGDLDPAASVLPDPNSLPEVAAVLYTSGSAGAPKGVEITHRGILRLVLDGEYIDFAPGDVVLHHAPATFDASLLEIWGALGRGATVAVAPPGPLSLDELSDFMRETGVTVAWLTAGLFHQLVELTPECFHGMRRVFAGGDVVSARHVRTVLDKQPGLELVNGYGPTENTTFTCCHLVRSAAELSTTTVPIGRPIANTQVFVVDRYGQPVPPGVTGELWAAGDGLAVGYAERPDLSAERFVTPRTGPFAGTRVYRTGDLVRWRPDGVLEFIGRSDLQVKINGFRIEIGEVEATLSAIPGIDQACVVLDTDALGGKRLSAFVIGDVRRVGGPLGLRTALRSMVPGFLVPGRFIFVDRFPLTLNGKVDRARLLHRSGTGTQP
jgi:amino acid adenylation domain-containing protein